MPIEQTEGVGHFAIRVRDIERSKKFYGETLGFPLIREQKREDDTVVNFMAHGMVFGIRGNHAKTGSDDEFDPFRVGLDHFALHVADAATLPRLVEQLDEAGVRHNGIHKEESGVEYICFYDPDGIPWELFAVPAQAGR